MVPSLEKGPSFNGIQVIDVQVFVCYLYKQLFLGRKYPTNHKMHYSSSVRSLQISGYFLAEISVSSPRKLVIFVIYKNVFWIKVFEKRSTATDMVSSSWMVTARCTGRCAETQGTCSTSSPSICRRSTEEEDSPRSVLRVSVSKNVTTTSGKSRRRPRRCSSPTTKPTSPASSSLVLRSSRTSSSSPSSLICVSKPSFSASLTSRMVRGTEFQDSCVHTDLFYLMVQVSIDKSDTLGAKNPSGLSRIRVTEGCFSRISRIRRLKIVRLIEGPTYCSPTYRWTPVMPDVQG